MTPDTTMTDVDTSKIAVINIVSAFTHMMEKSGGASVEREVLRLAIEKIEALAAERDELERLAGEINDLIADTRGVDGWHRNGDIASWDECLSDEARQTLTAYQRKGE